MNEDKRTRPFIIWTLRRTGGTNLATRLMALSQYPKLEHEPFNPDRVHGHVTRNWVEHCDGYALDEESGRSALVEV